MYLPNFLAQTSLPPLVAPLPRDLTSSSSGVIGRAAQRDSNMQVGFCDSNGHGFYLEQPRDQLERWAMPIDNGTHLTIPWTPDRRSCGLNVSSYWVDVKTSTPVLNFFMGVFGSFPQDLCAPGGSKARDAVQVSEEAAGTCSPYGWGCTTPRTTAFEVPAALRQMTKMDVSITVRGYGSLSPLGRPHERTPCTFWCHAYRRAPSLSGPPPSEPWAVSRRPKRRGLGAAWRWLASRGKPAESIPTLERTYEGHRAQLLRLYRAPCSREEQKAPPLHHLRARTSTAHAPRAACCYLAPAPEPGCSPLAAAFQAFAADWPGVFSSRSASALAFAAAALLPSCVAFQRF